MWTTFTGRRRSATGWVAIRPTANYIESYDYEGLRRELLDPLQPGGSRLYRTAIFDCMLDSPIESDRLRAYDGTILVVDGLFLDRCARRDGSASEPADASNRRYVVGETRYLNECRPQERASIVIDNSELSRPVRLR